MAWTTSNDRAGTGVPGVIYDVKLNDIGAINRFRDPIYGEADFVFLPGVASTAVGSVMEYTTSAGAASPTGTTTLWAGAVNSGKPLCIATVANVLTTNWAWYQISGNAQVAISGAVAAGDRAFWQANGVVSSTLIASKQANGMIATSANGVPSAGFASYQMHYPVAQGQVT
jgi:hypothetical protein